MCNHIETGIQEGAELLYDGRDVTVEDYEDGNFLGPTVLDDVTEDMVIAQEEIFGPVLGLASVEDIDRLSNGSIRVISVTLRVFSQAGAWMPERFVIAPTSATSVSMSAQQGQWPFFHFGGRKDSFFGDLHAQGEDAIEFYTEKDIYIERWPDEV